MCSESPDDRVRDPQKKEMKREYRSLAPFLTLGIQLAVAVVVFFLIGNWLDNKFEISPAGKLLGLLFGCIGGFYKFFSSIAALTKQEERQRASGKDKN